MRPYSQVEPNKYSVLLKIERQLHIIRMLYAPLIFDKHFCTWLNLMRNSQVE